MCRGSRFSVRVLMTWFDLFNWVSESILTYEIRIWTSQMWNTFCNFSLGSCRRTSVDMNYESSFYLLWCWITLRFFFNFLFYIGIQLINNVVMVSGEEWRDSAILIHVSVLPETPLPSRLAHHVLYVRSLLGPQLTKHSSDNPFLSTVMSVLSTCSPAAADSS